MTSFLRISHILFLNHRMGGVSNHLVPHLHTLPSHQPGAAIFVLPAECLTRRLDLAILPPFDELFIKWCELET
jgi:hypothetical protein